MSILSQLTDGLPIQSYTNAKLLAANVPESFTVPSGETNKLAMSVVLGKGEASDIYVSAFTANEITDRVTNGTFAEYITNGAFATDTGWTKGTGWTIAAGVADSDGTQTAVSLLTQSSAITLIQGHIYTITYTTTRSAGTVTPSIGGTAGTARSTAATFTETIVAGSTEALAFTASADFVGTLDNVSVTAWVLGTGWTTDGATAIATGAISTALSQTANQIYPIVAGQAYLVTYTATRSAGDIAISLGGTAGTTRSTSATFAEVIIAGASQAISFATTAFTGTVDNVTIVACASVPGDVTTGLASMQNPVGLHLNETKTVVSIVSASTPIVTATFYK